MERDETHDESRPASPRLLLLLPLIGALATTAARGVDGEKDLGLQLAANPPMRFIAKEPPPLPEVTEDFETRDGFVVIDSLAALREALEEDGQRIRMKPGVYRATDVGPPLVFSREVEGRDGEVRVRRNEQEHVFALTGSDNWFDLRGVVIETPVSVQSRLTHEVHVADTWHVNGSGNTIEGAYFRNVVDRPYPEYHVTENEFEIQGDGNTFLDCKFLIKGSVPYGYTDYYGKGGPNFGRLNKHSFLSIEKARDTKLIGCEVYMQSFGHCVHFHGADGVLIEDCLFSGTLRPTNDIFAETVGRAKEYGFHIMYRGRRPIPRDHMIPLTEDGVRSYGGDRNITVRDTTVERLRGCFQLLCEGDVTLERVTVREAGDFGFDLSSGRDGKVVMKDCRADFAYSPLLNLTRGPVPVGALYEVTVLSPAEDANPTPRTSLGKICGEDCTFILRDGTTAPLPEEVARLECGVDQPLVDSTVTNYTRARLVLGERSRGNVVRSVGPVDDLGTGNTVTHLEADPAREHE